MAGRCCCYQSGIIGNGKAAGICGGGMEHFSIITDDLANRGGVHDIRRYLLGYYILKFVFHSVSALKFSKVAPYKIWQNWDNYLLVMGQSVARN